MSLFLTARMLSYTLPTAATGLVLAAIGVGALRRQRRPLLARLFSLAFGLGAAAYLSMAGIAASQSDETALLLTRVTLSAMALFPAAFYHFIILCTRLSPWRQIAIRSVWAIGSLLAAVSAGTNFFAPTVQLRSWGAFPHLAPSASILAAFFVGVLLLSLSEVYVATRRASRGPRRERLLRLLRSGTLFSLTAWDFIPLLGADVYPFGFLGALLALTMAGQTIIRYQLNPSSQSLPADQIVDTMADAMIVVDSRGRIRVVNHAVRTLLGYEEHELIGKPLNQLIGDPDSTLTSTSRLRVALASGTLRDQERTFRSKSGEKVDVSLSLAPIIRHDRNSGAVIIARDIRQRKAAELKIKDTASILRSTLESTSDGILVVNRSGGIVSYNQRFVNMWEIPEEVLEDAEHHRGLDFVIVQLSDSDAFAKTMASLSDKPEAESLDVVSFRDGRIFELHSMPQRVDGTTVGRVWNFRDVTDRRKAESALRASEKRYRMLFEKNLAGVYRTTLEGKIIDCNDACARIFGCSSREELMALEADDYYFDPEERKSVLETLKESQNVTGLEACLRKKDGSPVWVLENISLIEGKDGEEPVLQGTLVDISDLKIAEEQMEFQAYHDVLTLLPNRKLFIDRLANALAHARRTSTMVGIMFLDLDHFKNINDTLGHTAGDEFLLTVAERLRGSVREEDTVARLGGDEFTVLVAGLEGPEDAARIGQKILDSMKRPFTLGDRELYVTSSIGIALFPDDGSDAESLLKNADRAMYRAKDLGRNNYQLCTPELKTRAVERLSLEHSLRDALNRHEFMLHYQPVINVSTGRIVGLEALVRWQHPQRGLVQPDGFIPLAEDSRLIVPLGEWVLQTACNQAQKWILEGFGPLRICVNLSARQFQQRDLVAMVSNALHESLLNPGSLELEITEGTAMSDVDRTIDVLHQLREIGVSISIDDFGTGYSSLNYLKRFPIDTVKIDKSFVRDVTTDRSDAAIVSAVIGIAKILNLRVIAEGIETEEQLAFLRNERCDEMQGFLFSEPLTAEALTARLKEGMIFVPTTGALLS